MSGFFVLTIFFPISYYRLLLQSMKKILSILLFVFLSASVSAQSYAFKVLVNKGKNEVKTTGGWQSVKVGVAITEKDEIKIGANSYVGLVHASGKPLELKEAKTYKVADLVKQMPSGSSVVTKYTDFILSSNSQKGNNIGATGAVDRGKEAADLHVNLPVPSEQAVFFNSRQTITWDSEGLKGPFVVSFQSLFEDELKIIQTAENSVTIDLDGREFDSEDNILVEVISKADGKRSARLALKRLSKPDRAHVEKLLKELSAQTSEPIALNKYILAAFFEENKLYIDAATQYAEAIRLAPDVDLYKDEFNNFLLRTGIKKKK